MWSQHTNTDTVACVTAHLTKHRAGYWTAPISTALFPYVKSLWKSIAGNIKNWTPHKRNEESAYPPTRGKQLLSISCTRLAVQHRLNSPNLFNNRCSQQWARLSLKRYTSSLEEHNYVMGGVVKIYWKREGVGQAYGHYKLDPLFTLNIKNQSGKRHQVQVMQKGLLTDPFALE